MSVIIALVVLLIFFLLVGKFAKCCYYFYTSGTDVTPPYYVAPNPIHRTNPNTHQISHCPTYDHATAPTPTIAVRGLIMTPEEYQQNLALSSPPSYYEDPPPPYEQVCGDRGGDTSSVNKHQSRQI